MKTFITALFTILTVQLFAQTVTVRGTVTDEQNVPLFGASIIIDGTTKGTEADFDGNYSLETNIGTTLVFSYLGTETQRIEVESGGTMNVTLQPSAETMDPITIVTYGKPKSERMNPTAVTTLTPDDISVGQGDVLRNMMGKVPGTSLIPVSGAIGSGVKFNIRSMSSITGNNDPLIIVDGMPFNTNTNDIAGFAGGGAITSSRILDLDPNNIAKIQVLRGLSATVLYGQEGRNGVVLITTKTGTFSDEALAPAMPYSERYLAEQERVRTKLANERTYMELGYESPYQNTVKDILQSKDRFKAYLVAEKNSGSDAAFYVDIFDRFKKIDPEFAEQVLQSYAEVETKDVELLKTLAFKLEEQNQVELAAKVYAKVLKIESDDIQTQRNFALVVANLGKEKEAANTLTALMGNSKNMNKILATEYMNLTSNIAGDIGIDMRIVVDWNRDDADLDMQVIDPNLEVSSVNNKRSRAGGVFLSNDEAGFGPEVFEIKKVQSGSYYLKIGYSGAQEEILKNDFYTPKPPAYVKLTIFRNFGRSNQTKEVKLVRISGEEPLTLIDRIAVL